LLLGRLKLILNGRSWFHLVYQRFDEMEISLIEPGVKMNGASYQDCLLFGKVVA